MYRYAFVSTLPDLLDAHEAQLTERTGVRRWIRLFPLGMGWAWLLGAVLTLTADDVRLHQSVVWFLLGSVVLYWFQVKPLRERRAIRAQNAERQPVELAMDETGLRAAVEGVGELTRAWTELVEVRGAKRGVSLIFDDGTVNWLPNRVFEQPADKRRFVDSVATWTRTALERAVAERLAKEEAWGLGEDDFWRLIEELDWSRPIDGEAVIAPVVELLSQRDERAIRGFQEHLAEQLHTLDREDLARHMGEGAYTGPDGPFSEERFLGVRCVVVANGWLGVRAMLDHPESLTEAQELSALLEIAPRAFEAKTGRSFDHVPETPYAAFANADGWPSRREG